MRPFLSSSVFESIRNLFDLACLCALRFQGKKCCENVVGVIEFISSVPKGTHVSVSCSA